MAITKDIVVDYGADNTGVANAAPAFYTGLQPDMAGEDCTLTIPAGTYKMQPSGGGASLFWAKGHASLSVTATGATLNTSPILGAFAFSNIGIDDVNGKSARIRTVSPGATTVVLTAESTSDGHISRAVVGQWMCVAGFDTQGLFLSAYGFPINSHFFDYVQITATGTDPSTGLDTISFTPALSNFYSDQWPCFNRGTNLETDSGGPASVFFLHSGWGGPITYEGGTFDSSAQISCAGADVTLSNPTTTNNSLLPSATKTLRLNNYTNSGGATIEHDKLTDAVYVDGGTYSQWHGQSSSNRYLELKNASFTLINGTVKNTVIDNCTISGNLLIGPVTNGTGETFICRDSTVSGTISSGGISTTGGGGNLGLVANMCTMANGLITIPLHTGAEAWMRVLPPDPYGRNVVFLTADARPVKGYQVKSITADTWPAADDQSTTTNITITSGDNTLEVSDAIFQASDVGKVILVNGGRTGTPTQMRSVITGFTDSTHVDILDNFTISRTASAQTVQWGTFNAYVQTNQTGGFPSTSIGHSVGKFGFQAPAARTVNFENVTGSALAVDLSQAAARNRPLYSYTKRTYDGLNGSAALKMIGNVVSIKFNVITAYTGAASVLKAGFSQFNNLAVVVNDTATTYGPRIDLKTPGERVITVGSTTGAQPNDSGLDISDPMWITGVDFGIFIGNNSAGTAVDISGESAGVRPEFTVEIITDQGFYTGPVAVVPLRMRLRAA